MKYKARTSQVRDHEYFFDLAGQEALKNLRLCHGGPFGAVIVRNNRVIASARNMIWKTNDFTAHAEITAIRSAERKLQQNNLRDCTIYSSCEPCPMCLFAIHWARIRRVYYAATRFDAARAGFDAARLYKLFAPNPVFDFQIRRIKNRKCKQVLIDWKKYHKPLY